jgi:hypothetical protein
VAAWPAVALVGSYELFMMVIRSSQVPPADAAPRTGRDAGPLREREAGGKPSCVRFPQSRDQFSSSYDRSRVLVLTPYESDGPSGAVVEFMKTALAVPALAAMVGCATWTPAARAPAASHADGSRRSVVRADTIDPVAVAARWLNWRHSPLAWDESPLAWDEETF